jgi:2OG-Fe(II) oxygenase superfamily
MEPMLNPRLQADVDVLAARFRQRDPFRHIVIDDFLTPDFCKQLLSEFPAFERGNARNEAGELGKKSTIEKIRGLGPSYTALDNLIQTRGFLDFIGHITGIAELLYDPWYFGGGTHENRHGQDLDAHVDFNRHPVERWHRRLNLIVYLNPEWNPEWGGCLDLHSDPRSPDNRTIPIAPLYNRAVIFETTEWSWHGFKPIDLPQDKRDVSRRSIALYFYTKDRPADELADTHSTIYVDRPLPDRFQPGLTLGAADVEELRILLARRDHHMQRLYHDVTDVSRQLEMAKTALASGSVGKVWYFARRVFARLRR